MHWIDRRCYIHSPHPKSNQSNNLFHTQTGLYDADYPKLLLQHAEELFDFGTRCPGHYVQDGAWVLNVMVFEMKRAIADPKGQGK